jgi:hypothetical protein
MSDGKVIVSRSMRARSFGPVRPLTAGPRLSWVATAAEHGKLGTPVVG